MATCKYCNSEISDESSAAVIQAIETRIPDWSKFESEDSRWGYPDNSIFDINLINPVTLVARKLKPHFDEMEGSYFGEGEYGQGTTFETFVILSYGDRFFKKTGTADSYGEINWYDGTLSEVKPKVVTATVWE